MDSDQARRRPARDLDDPSEVAELVRCFYAKVDVDDLLGPMFHEVAGVDWPEHLVKLTAFWCRALFGIPGYRGNPFRAHALVHARRSFTVEHFERWLTLFAQTLEDGWQGPKADQAIDVARKVPRCTPTNWWVTWQRQVAGCRRDASPATQALTPR